VVDAFQLSAAGDEPQDLERVHPRHIALLSDEVLVGRVPVTAGVVHVGVAERVVVHVRNLVLLAQPARTGLPDPAHVILERAPGRIRDVPVDRVILIVDPPPVGDERAARARPARRADQRIIEQHRRPGRMAGENQREGPPGAWRSKCTHGNLAFPARFRFQRFTRHNMRRRDSRPSAPGALVPSAQARKERREVGSVDVQISV
jgi:hypothetical protein